MKGNFAVVDGLDGLGKGIIINTWKEEAKKEGCRVFDVHQFWQEHDYHPNPKDIIGNYELVLTSEPTFVGIGKVIRQEIIAKNGRDYSAEVQLGAYALDRHILYEKLLLPLLEAGIKVYQSRSFSTSLVYQRQVAWDQGQRFEFKEIIKEIMSIPGNAFCLRRPMDYLFIPTIFNVEEALRRAQAREKDDNCEFENLEFQLKIKPHYESSEYRELFENWGIKVSYIDVGSSLEHSQQQAREFYRQYLSKK
jgi:thymidylate kinase